jgi:hypothetical protein
MIREVREIPRENEIDFARVADWIHGRLSEEEARSVEEQLATADEETRYEVELLRTFIEASNSIVLAKPPPDVTETLASRFEAHARGWRQPGLVRRLVANLTLDSGFQSAGAGARSTGNREAERQLFYSTDVVEIVLEVLPRLGSRGLDLSGQVFPRDDEATSALTIHLLRDAKEIGITSTDDFGEFEFEDVPPGVYEMVLSGEGVEILISALRLAP